VPAAVLPVLAALLVMVGGCSITGSDGPSASRSGASPSATATTAAPSPLPGLTAYYRQHLDWTACRDTDECAQLQVPLDYAKPSGRSIGISVLKVPATGGAHRLGSMVVDPGGPGVSGVDYAAGAEGVYGVALRRVYDIVGFDPRGVGSSTPLRCASDQQLDTVLTSDPDPDSPAEARRSQDLMRDLGRGCLRDSGDLARHISTVEVAKDLDVLRAALGDTRLTYFGASYGTFIGATYANLFPRRVGRMVLDGALDPRSTSLELNLVQAHGFEVALRAYVGACVAEGDCFLGATVDEGTGRIRSFLDDVEAAPVTTASGRRLTAADAQYGISYPLYARDGWAVLDTALRNAFAGDASLLMGLADGYLHRNADGSFADNAFEAFYAVNCLDHDDGIPASQWRRYLPRFERASPTFGAAFAYSTTTCDTWPVHTGRGPERLRAVGSPPIMVVGTTRDPATPLVWARALAAQLDRGVLVTRDGDGHTAYRRGSACVDDTVERYLVDGAVPRREVHCG
jgi:pimeloyl-ACP methyl ester carboxylesterase